ncbi:hypothetical protein PPL19_08011 [Pseudomonas psychrotolerans L19]|nr:hypothetical protein PPL19_08011 [Pseudomonas psychrotolerans L19]
MHQVDSTGFLGESSEGSPGKASRGEVDVLPDSADGNAIHLEVLRNRTPAECQDPVIDSGSLGSQAHLTDDVFDATMGVG